MKTMGWGCYIKGEEREGEESVGCHHWGCGGAEKTRTQLHFAGWGGGAHESMAKGHGSLRSQVRPFLSHHLPLGAWGWREFSSWQSRGKLLVLSTFLGHSPSWSRRPGVTAGSKGPGQRWDPSPPAALGAPPHYLLESGAISVALALKIRPRAAKAHAARGPCSGWFYVLNTTGREWPPRSQDLHSKSKARPSRPSHVTRVGRVALQGKEMTVFSVVSPGLSQSEYI